MFSLILTYYLVQLTLALVLLYGAKKSANYIPLPTAEPTTIIVPFKNEAARFKSLIDAINKTAIAHKKSEIFSQLECIFVDDHSSDNSINVLLDELDISFKIIKLKDTFGKKFAIKKGVEAAKHQRILTVDGDVSFSVDYLNYILTTPCDGLTILPVNMNHSSLIGKLNACEFWFFQRLTFGLAGFKTFELCNGANLLFTKSAFNKALEVRTDAHVPSGDDIFLLKALQQLSLPITAINNKRLSVNTEPPLNFKTLISQRKRWLSKTTDASSILGGLFVLGSNLLLPICVYLSITENIIFIVPILIKLLAELISVDDIKNLFIVILHQITYPIYLVALIFSLARPSKNVWRA